ncbi:hypothetical protein [Actinopolymorpha pittospori]
MGSLFEGGIRVPGTDLAGPGAMMDLVPTLLEAVDGSPPTRPDIVGR